jgi:hypothetical protein
VFNLVRLGVCTVRLIQVLPDYNTSGLLENSGPIKIGYCTKSNVPNLELLSFK